MKKQQSHQLHIIWDYIASPIKIPAEIRERSVDLLCELLSAYWQECKEELNKDKRRNEDDK